MIPIIAISGLGFVCGYIFAIVYETTTAAIGKRVGKTKAVVLGYKIHHSIYGLIAIFSSLLFLSNIPLTMFLVLFGIGIIVQHYFTGDKLVFITKDH